MTTQVNIKLDEKLKKEAERLARKLGLSLSCILRAYLLQFIRNKRFDVTLDEDNDTPDDLTGAELTKAMIAEGEDPAYAKRHGEAYDDMLQAERDGTLIRII